MTTNNRVNNAGFSYDIAGNVLTDASFAYTWDAESQLKSAAGVNYTYDGDGRRVQKSNGKLYWYGATGDILAESDASGNISAEYVFFGGKRIARRDSSGNVFYYLSDHLDTSRVIAQSNGTVCYDADFDPFGTEDVFTNTCPQGYKFNGKERDAETGNDDFGARSYTPGFGRFLSPDWSAIPAPVPYADLTNPQSLNQYAFVKDNPVAFSDPSGHLAEGQIASSDGMYVVPRMRGGGDSIGIGDAVEPGVWEITVNGESSFALGTYEDAEASAESMSAQAQQQNMSLSSKGLAFIEQHEGYSSTVYKDSAGNPTIGYGHLIQKGEDFSKGITKDQANALLAGDVKGAVGAVNGDLKVAVSQTKFDALVDFTYNLGGKNFANSTLLSNINAGKAVIESNFTSYNHAGGKVVPGLTIRRTDEFNLFSRGDYGGP
ncbi:MAG: RHS repeat-associated core domain-containing protein [Candidatus Acidiferrum sp.]